MRYIEIANDTDQQISFGAWDDGGLCVIPYQPINARAILTYEAKYGAPINKLSWQASQDGLVGYFVVERKSS